MSVNGSIEDEVATYLESLGALAVTTAGATDEPWLEAGLPTPPKWGEVTVTGLYAMDADADALVGNVAAKFDGAPVLRSVLADRDWEREYLQHFSAIEVGHDFWIVPSFADEDVQARYQLRLDPGLAFGTGSHPTTAMCLDWMSRRDLAGLDVIDYGCGSGILAIAALLLGARHALGIDIDPRALTASRENALENNVSERLDLIGSNAIPPDATADLVVANILAGTLIELVDDIASRVRPGGALLLSGILSHQAESVASAFARSGKSGTWRRGDWMLLFITD